MTTRPISQRQLDDAKVRLQRAACASHRRGQRVEATRNVAALVLAALGLIVTTTGHDRALVTILGFFWFLVASFLLRRAMSAIATQGAVLQEQFDTALFGLPWRHSLAGDPLGEYDVARLARKVPVGSRRDRRITAGWYARTDGVRFPYDVFIAQEQNLAWDSRLRRTYAAVILAAAAGWIGLGLVLVGFVGGATVQQMLLSFFAPSLAALQLAAEIWHGQRRVADERDRLGKIVYAELRLAAPGPSNPAEVQRLTAVARDVQDGIYRTRLDVARVPEWLYRLNREADLHDFADTADNHRRRLATP
ncbi:S-4TM family putative pore-forming effector [Micromonospora sp. NPDC049257]|uniref:S-4TM family putative pore-forming effector n=1 Tax=Micromonospora sp. NPDC049257 TaxID=3155771 RepID=UPI00344A720D